MLWPVAGVLHAAEEEEGFALPAPVQRLSEVLLSYGAILFFIGLLVTVAVVLSFYKKTYSSYLPKQGFSPPHLVVLATIVMPLYGLTCAVFGIFALTGNPVAIEQLGGVGRTWYFSVTAGGVALALLGVLLYFGNRLACALIVAILAMDLCFNLRGLVSGFVSINAVPLRVSMEAVILLLAVWTWITISGGWRKVREARPSGWRRIGPR